LDEEQVEILIAALQPEIDLAPSLSLLANEVVESLTRLTEEQIRVMSAASVNPRLIVTGRAGTGKTMLAQHETRRLADEVARVLLVYPNPNLALRSREALKNPDRVTVTTFQQLADGVSGDPFDSLVIDEAQDLPERLLPTLDRILKGGLEGGTWRIFLDPAQSVLGEVAPMDTRLHNAAARLHLSLNCRNTRQIAVFTSMLTRMDLDLDAPAEGPDVTQLWFNDDGQHDELLRQELVRLAEDLDPERVAILSEQRPTADELDALSTSSGIRVRLISDSEPGAVTASSVDDFQGLESDAVIVTNLRGLDAVPDKRLAYVACTRARVQLSVLMNEDLRSSYQDGARWFGRRLTARGG
jgi:DNA helicase IV